jgi:hypothetical protein
VTLDTITTGISELIENEAWPEVARALVGRPDPGDAMLRTLAINLESMRVHRPALYATVLEAIRNGAIDAAYQLFNPRQTDERSHATFVATRLLRQHGRTVALGGVGDGKVLRAFCRFPPKLILNRQQEVMVIEPEPARLISALTATDLSGPRGAFEQRRITWYVGPNWIDNLTNDLINEPARVAPIRAEPTVDLRQEIYDGIDEIEKRLAAKELERRAEVTAYYESLPDDELVNVLGPNPRRKPRMLMLTSQFSSVLQYSTNDSADAMRQLGWDVEICTERDLFHSMSPQAVLASIASFKPDAIFHIDHLRYEMADIFPANLPHICWIQDHLTNLANDFAGKSVTDRDFVLTGATYRYVSRYGYPRRQCVDMAKSSRPPVLPAQWKCDREDVFYVSHWSSKAEPVVAEMCQRTRELAGPLAERAMYDCCAEMVATYARGESFPTMQRVRALIWSVFDRLDYLKTPETEHFFVDALFLRLNNILYRQQALTWTAEIAEELGLKFGIYGRDWDKHPTLGKYARGVVEYGPDLEELTRESKILLQLEPYACYTHQRMLDALLAGGFTLVREHPLNTIPIQVRQFLDAYVPPDVISVDAAMESLAPPLREQFEALLNQASDIAAMGDVVDVVRGWQRAGLIGDGDVALPCLNDISFNSKETLRRLITQFTNDEESRRRIASAQRRSVLDRLTYYQTLKGAMGRIHGLLRESVEANRVQTFKEAA